MTTIRFIILHPLLTMWHLHPFHIGGSRRRQWHPTPVLLPGKSHGQRSLVGCSSWGREESDTTKRLNFHFSLSCIGEGNGNPLHCSCLENPRDGGAWWAAVYGVTQNQTWLKRLSSSSSSDKEPACQCRRPKRYRLISGSGRSPAGGHGNPLQCSCLENPMVRGFWWSTVHRVTKSWTWLKGLSPHTLRNGIYIPFLWIWVGLWQQWKWHNTASKILEICVLFFFFFFLRYVFLKSSYHAVRKSRLHEKATFSSFC